MSKICVIQKVVVLLRNQSKRKEIRMKKFLNATVKLLINEKFLTTILIIYALLVFFGEQFAAPLFTLTVWVWIDFAVTVIFLLEMFIRLHHDGLKRYIKHNWFDAVVVLLSLPSLFVPFVEMNSLHMVLILRLLRLGRIMRVFLLFQYLPNINKLLKGFLSGLKQTASILMGFILVMFVFGLISYALFKDMSMQFFGTPLQSLHSMFQLFIIDGWLEITHSVSAGMEPMEKEVIYFYFIGLVALLGIVGMAFITSIFVDAMGEKENDDVQKKLNKISKKLDMLLDRQDEMEKHMADNNQLNTSKPLQGQASQQAIE